MLTRRGLFAVLASLTIVAAPFPCLGERPEVTPSASLAPIAELWDNVSIQLMALFNATHWWRPDGTVLENPPYQLVKELEVIGWTGAVFNVTAPEEAGVRIKIPRSHQRNVQVRKPDEAPGKSIRAVAFRLFRPQTLTTIRARIAAGPWDSKIRNTSPSCAVASTFPDDTGVVFHPLFRDQAYTAMIIAHDFGGAQVRALAEGDDGRVYPAADRRMLCAHNIHSLTCYWSVPISEIKSVLLQVRSYESLEFKDVALIDL